MSKLIKIFLINICVLFIFSCQNDTFDIPGNPQGKDSYKISIAGVVNDIDGRPIEGVEVVYQNEIVVTGRLGVYYFENVDVNSKHNSINFNKIGYFETVRTFRVAHNSPISQTTVLLAQVYNQSFPSNQGGIVQSGKTTIEFSPNSIVEEVSGSLYVGTVQVAINYLDPTMSNIDAQMPGDLTALDTLDNYMVLSSFGMNYVQLKSPDGSLLQIKSGETAKMKSEIPSSIVGDAPDQINMWSFDYDRGLWIQEGKAIKVNDSYEGEVSHFSCWNYDVEDPSIIASGRLVDNFGNPIKAQVRFQKMTYGGASGSSNAYGYFAGAVPKDQLLNLRIIFNGELCRDLIVLDYEVGPFADDVEMGDIVLDITQFYKFKVDAEFIDCSDNKLERFIVFFDNELSLINGSRFQSTVSKCQDDHIEMKVVDPKTLLESFTYRIQVGNNNFSDIKICDTEIANVIVNSNDLNMSEVLINDCHMSYYESRSSSTFSAYNDGEISFISLSLKDAYDDGYKVGTYDVENGYIHNAQLSTIDYLAESGQVNIDEVDNVTRTMQGSYTVTGRKEGGSELIDFYGTFKLEF